VSASMLIAFLLSTTVAVGFENLVANGDFNSHVAYFDLRFAHSGDVMDWDAEDSDGNPSSGSMAITEADGSGAIFGSQCIPVLGGNEYHFGGDMKIQTGTGATKILLQQFSSIDCSTGFISNFSDISIAVGMWTPADEVALFDPNANSVWLGGWFDNYTSSPATAKFDNISLYSETVIFFDHFEYGDLLQWDQWVP